MWAGVISTSFVDLFQQAKTKLHARGEDVHQVYAARRRDMPGATF